MKKLYLTAAIILCLCGCTDFGTPQATQTPAATSQVSETNEKTIDASADMGKYDDMNVFEDCEYNIVGGENDTIALLTDAQKDDEGEFLWDDGHDWALVVKSEGRVYSLYDEYTRAKPQLYVSEVYKDDGDTEPVIRLVLSSGSAFEIREYRYDGNVFSEKTAYNSGAINELQVNQY